MPYTLEYSPKVDFTNKDDKVDDNEIKRTCPTNGEGMECYHRDMENGGGMGVMFSLNGPQSAGPSKYLIRHLKKNIAFWEVGRVVAS